MRAFAYDLSLYRPDSKEGDPRFWPSILKKGRVSYPSSISLLGEGPSFPKVCSADDLYAAIVIDGVFVILRLTRHTLALFSKTENNSLNKGQGFAELRCFILGGMPSLS